MQRPTIFFALIFFIACGDANERDPSHPICFPDDSTCANEDFDDDGVMNKDDHFPTDPSCALRNEQNCSACGVGCDQSEKCSQQGSCESIEQERCDGVDNDLDGRVDEEIEDAPTGTLTAGLCSESRKSCIQGVWVEPNYLLIEGFESSESLCDGIDSDCDGEIDEGLSAPFALNQRGVCAGALKVCKGPESWAEPELSDIAGYESEESVCDGIDSDCDGRIDEGLDAPLATVQEGLCSGTRKICMGHGGWAEPNRSQIEGFETAESTCDGIDNDCDGSVDEELIMPFAEEQTGICVGLRRRCVEGRVEAPLFAVVSGYEETEITCDGLDNDCDGLVDEGISQALASRQDGVCAGALQHCINGTWVEPNYLLIAEYQPSDQSCDGLDNDCDGVVDEGVQVLSISCGVGSCQRSTIARCEQGVLERECTEGLPQAYDDCNGLDDDCDGRVDEGDPPLSLIQDGICNGLQMRCVTGQGWTEPEFNHIPFYEGDEQSCDGLDNDCDGEVDEDSVNADAPLAIRQFSLCEGSKKTCINGLYQEPSYEDLFGDRFEENERSCDGLDNDCDGAIDEELQAPEAIRQKGVCASSIKTCGGQVGWLEPDYSTLIESYEFNEVSCDGLDNDCDGEVDEHLEPPLATNQYGVCDGTRRVCRGTEGWSEPNVIDLTATYELSEQSCDGLDNDCDGLVDERLSPPLAQRQAGVCAGSLKVCEGVQGWAEPNYEESVSLYGEVDVRCDGEDNDCDGQVDEGGIELCNDGLDNDCDGDIDELECSSVCGDGLLDAGRGEECDDGNQLEGDGCDVSCLIELCGNGRVESNEECDDGNTETESCEYGTCTVCSSNCTEVAGTTSSYCGDGVINGPENCDGEPWCGSHCEGSPPPCSESSAGCPPLDFVLIEGGTFIMGSDNQSSERPPHEVTISRFEIQRHEITVGEYRRCVDAGVCTEPAAGTSLNELNWTSEPDVKEDHPVNGVRWFQLMEFAAWVGARLPSEAEWEYAAKSQGREITHPWGEEPPSCALLDYDNETCGYGTSRVCSFPDGFTDQGLCDMAGNVFEWVLDQGHYTYDGAPNDGSAWCDGLCPLNADDPQYLDRFLGVYRGNHEITRRVNVSASTRASYLGGRLARSID